MEEGILETEVDNKTCRYFFYRYHLQALRHLYVQAAEPRLLLPIDIDTDDPCSVSLEIQLNKTTDRDAFTLLTSTPTILPSLSSITSVRCADRSMLCGLTERFQWFVVMTCNANTTSSSCSWELRMRISGECRSTRIPASNISSEIILLTVIYA